MPRTRISEFSATAADNTDIDNINIAEGCAPSGINNAIRELMAQLKDMQTGASGDAFTLTTVNSTTVDTTNLEATNLKAKDGTAAGSIADSTGIVTLASTVLTTTDINGGTIDATTIGASTPSTVVATQVDITAQGDLRLQDTTGGEYVALQAPSTIATSYTLTLPVDDGTSGQALITDGSGVLSWSSAASGDVYGPGSATDNAVARYDGTTGKIIQNSAVTIADDGATVIAANSTTDGLRITQLGTGNALLVEDSANPDATPFVVDTNGNVGIGESSPSTYVTNGLVLKSTAAFMPAVITWNKANDASPSLLTGRKDRNGAIVQSGDELYRIFATGYDGASYISAAQITANVDGTPGTNDMPGRLVFSTTADGASSPTERMRIDNAGRVGFGAGAGGDTSVLFARNLTGAATSYAVRNLATVQSDVTTTAHGFISQISTAAAAFTMAGGIQYFSAFQGTFGAGSTVTNQFGFRADASLTGATNNYGFYSNIASGTGRWNFYANGTAANFFAGNTGIGTSTLQGVLTVGAGTASGTTDDLQKWQWTGSAANYGLTLSQVHTGSTIDYAFKIQNNSATQNTRLYFASNGTISLGAAPGAESLRVTPVASAVNYWSFAGRAAGASPYVQAEGSDTNIDLLYAAKGTGAHIFYTAGFSFTPQFQIAHTASAVNYLQVTGSASTTPTLSAQGSGANVDITLTPKGTGSVNLLGGNGTGGISGPTSRVWASKIIMNQDQDTYSGLSVQNRWATATAAIFEAAMGFNGTSAGYYPVYTIDGLGQQTFRAGAPAIEYGRMSSNGVWSLGGAPGAESLRVTPVSSAVNYWNFNGNGATFTPFMLMNGSDTNISAVLATKGTGRFEFYTGATSGLTGTVPQFQIAHTASAVNYLQVTGGATGNAATLSAQGSDTNIDLALTPKGTGKVQFGTLTATSDVAITGFIEVKDSAGNVRKLAVIS